MVTFLKIILSFFSLLFLSSDDQKLIKGGQQNFACLRRQLKAILYWPKWAEYNLGYNVYLNETPLHHQQGIGRKYDKCFSYSFANVSRFITKGSDCWNSYKRNFYFIFASAVSLRVLMHKYFEKDTKWVFFAMWEATWVFSSILNVFTHS